MSKSSKYVLASGCSFTDQYYKSWQLPDLDCSWPKWPELLGNKLDLRVVNLGRSAASNNYIYRSLINTIVKDYKNIELVVVGWTSWFRVELFTDLSNFGPNSFRSRGRYNFIGMNNPDRKDYFDKFYGFEAKGVVDSIYNSKKSLKELINHNFTMMFDIQELCKALNIKLIQSQLLVSCDKYFFGNTRKAKKKFMDFMFDMNFCDYKEKISEKQFIFMPHKYNGHMQCLDMLIKPSQRISVSCGDYHPNELGQQVIFKEYYKKYKELYDE